MKQADFPERIARFIFVQLITAKRDFISNFFYKSMIWKITKIIK